MLDMKFIRDNAELVRGSASLKNFEIDLDHLITLDEKRRGLMAQVESAKADQRKRSKGLGGLDEGARAAEVAALSDLKGEIRKGEETLSGVLDEWKSLMLRVPNVAAADVPEGVDDTDNVELRRWGEPPKFDFDALDHLALGERHQLVDIERGVKMSGARFYVLHGQGALLHRATLNFAFDHMLAKGYQPLEVPVLVRDHAMEGTAYFPGGEEQSYRIEKDGLNLVGTAEVPVTSVHAGEILERDSLPRRLVARSSCFRREAGAAGKDTKGLYRIHQFEKVEQVQLIEPDDEASLQAHEEILRNAEEVVQAFELPYRVVNVCGGDLGLPQVQKFDIEVWMPSRGGYCETHSASRFHDFQARRLDIRTRDESGKTVYCHTLNNTVIASPRILIPLLECHQQSDGKVVIPDALRPYMGGASMIGGET